MQWQLSTNSGGAWGDIPGATHTALDLMSTVLANSGGQYRAVASNGAGTVYSRAAVLTVIPAPRPRGSAVRLCGERR